MKQINDIFHQVNELMKDMGPAAAPGTSTDMARRELKMRGLLVTQLCRIADALEDRK